MVARRAELARIRDAVRNGPGILVAGEAGVGKTALVATVTAEVTAAGGTVLWLAATEASRLTPFGAIGPLLPADVGALHPALVPGLVARRLAERGPTLLAVDDAQLLDDHSAAALLGGDRRRRPYGRDAADRHRGLRRGHRAVEGRPARPAGPRPARPDRRPPSCSPTGSAARSRPAPSSCCGPAARATRST